MTCKRPHVGIAVFVKNEEGKILMQRRTGSHGEGTWSLPGGKLEFGESWETCAQRETKEEACIDIGNVTFMTATNDVFPEGPHYVTIFMRAGHYEGKPTIGEPEKATKMGWFDWNELPTPLFSPLLTLKEQGFNP